MSQSPLPGQGLCSGWEWSRPGLDSLTPFSKQKDGARLPHLPLKTS